MFEGQYDDRISPLIEDSTKQHWLMVWWLLLRQYATGLVFGALLPTATCQVQLYALMAVWLLHLIYLSLFRPMIDPLSLAFEIGTLSMQLLVFALMLIDHLGTSIGVLPVALLLFVTVIVNTLFHFPGRHYGHGKRSLMAVLQRVGKCGFGARFGFGARVACEDESPTEPAGVAAAASTESPAEVDSTPSILPRSISLDSACSIPRPLHRRETYPPRQELCSDITAATTNSDIITATIKQEADGPAPEQAGAAFLSRSRKTRVTDQSLYRWRTTPSLATTSADDESLMDSPMRTDGNEPLSQEGSDRDRLSTTGTGECRRFQVCGELVVWKPANTLEPD